MKPEYKDWATQKGLVKFTRTERKFYFFWHARARLSGRRHGYFTQIVSGYTLMCWCARKGLEYSVARLIQAGHSPLAKCEDGKSCIEHCAASCVKNCFWGDCSECRHAGIKMLLTGVAHP